MAKTEEGGRGIVFSFQFSVGNRAYKALPQEGSLLQRADSIRIGLTKPSHKRVPSYKEQIVLESGLQSPPTRESPPTKEQIVLESGLQGFPPTRGFPPTKEQIVLESGLQSPPTREFRRTEEGNLKLYLTFVRK